MNMEPAVLYAAVSVVLYLIVAKRFRHFAFKARIDALARAQDLLQTETLPKSIRESLTQEFEPAPGPLAPWILAATFIPAFITSLATTRSEFDGFAEGASDATLAKMDGFLNSALAGILFRSPAATLLVLMQGVLLILIVAITSTPSLIRETLSRALGWATKGSDHAPDGMKHA